MGAARRGPIQPATS